MKTVMAARAAHALGAPRYGTSERGSELARLSVTPFTVGELAELIRSQL
jgi:hypothetical protein